MFKDYGDEVISHVVVKVREWILSHSMEALPRTKKSLISHINNIKYKMAVSPKEVTDALFSAKCIGMARVEPKKQPTKEEEHHDAAEYDSLSSSSSSSYGYSSSSHSSYGYSSTASSYSSLHSSSYGYSSSSSSASTYSPSYSSSSSSQSYLSDSEVLQYDPLQIGNYHLVVNTTVGGNPDQYGEVNGEEVVSNEDDPSNPWNSGFDTISSSSSSSSLSSKGKNFLFPDLDFNNYIVPHKISNFDYMSLSDNILRGVYSYGFENPSLVQSMAIPGILTNRDCIIQGHFGSGKTAAYIIPILNVLSHKFRERMLIVAPTRELAQQISRVAQSLAEYESNIKVCFCGGGNSVRKDMMDFKEANLVVGTPGRLLDLLNRTETQGSLLVVDDCCSLLCKSYQDAMYDILQKLKVGSQIIVVDSYITPECYSLTKKFLVNPLIISTITADSSPLPAVKHVYVDVDKEEYKLSALQDLFFSISISQTVIFVNTRKKCDWLTEQLTRSDFTVSQYHGDLDQNTRNTIMQEFRSGSSRILITLPGLFRGIDIHAVSLVVNYDVPRSNDLYGYFSRASSCSRFGRRGKVLNFTVTEDSSTISALRDAGLEIEEMSQTFLND
eukprot:TRINITY_DN1492_c0_g1_i1.p1 TRINITY_DN1492_c0_g1~~TRINITY_DN1492_c0_g1_i1.p1  ORF type:complete len:612 (+),score=114.62 TRINITY_DN1492_c0_g1_i1:1347-3182(+)